MGIVKYLQKSYAEAKIYLGDFTRVMEAGNSTGHPEYLLAIQILGEIHRIEGRPDDATALFSRAKQIIDANAALEEKLPGLQTCISMRLDASHPDEEEKKTLFSRFTELARFEDEVSGELPVEERLQAIIQQYPFLDAE